MRSLDRRPLALLVATGLAVVVMIPLAAGQEEVADTVLYGTLPLSLAIVGTLVASRHSENPIGWLFCGMGLGIALAELGEAYAYRAADNGLAGGAVGEWLISWSWVAEVSVWVVVILLFPDGRLQSRRWRLAIWVAIAGFLLTFIGQGLDPDTGNQFTSGENPLAVDSPMVEAALPVGIVLLVGALLSAVVSSVRRFRRSTGAERQQLKWFAYAGVLLAVLMPIAVAFWYRTVLIQAGVALAFNAMPLAVGVAILRYRLYDVDVLINRTLVYGALTATLAGAYLGLVLLMQLAISPLTEQSDLAIAGSTLTVAALFRPARSRIQAAVDRRFYRRKYDAQRTLESFGGRLRDQVDLEALGGELRAVVHDTVQPAHVSLWLKGGSG